MRAIPSSSTHRLLQTSCCISLGSDVVRDQFPGAARRYIHSVREASVSGGKFQLFLEQEIKNIGAGNETRTRDPNLGKVVLYQLSYSRKLLSSIVCNEP